MKQSRFVLAWAFLTGCSAMACGGASSDGGQSGTGIFSAIRGNVVAVTGASPDVASIRVSLSGTSLATQTDATGRFELRGRTSGPAELRFERQRDALLAIANVVIPAGGILELEQIVLDSDTGEAHPTRQLVEFEGVVEALDCPGGAIRIRPKDDDPSASVFTVEAASATIRDNGVVLVCSDLRVNDEVQVRAETSDGSALVNAVLELEEREDNQVVEFEGIVEAADCPGGAIRIRPKDDDPTASVFTVEAASATIRDNGVVLVCSDLRVNDEVQVRAETSDGSALVNAVLELEEREDNQVVEFEGIVEAADCAGGTIRVRPKDDDPTAAVFLIEAANATILQNGVRLACGDIRVGATVEVRGETLDGSTLLDAEIVIEDGMDGPGGTGQAGWGTKSRLPAPKMR